jgi:uncharacterized protein YndB with AHSA1/START domain
MTTRTIEHGEFVVERLYPASPRRVFRAWADPTIKARWFGDGSSPSQIFEFKVGGREYSAGKGPNDADFTFDLRYYDIVENQRIVYAYDMTMGGRRISVSVASIELIAEGDGTRMIVNEQGAYLDGLDNSRQRQEGTEWLMNNLGTELARPETV